MPAVAAVRLDVTANTASATRGIETLSKQLSSMQGEFAATASSVLSRVRARGVARAIESVGDSILRLRESFRGPDARPDGFDRAVGTLGAAAQEAGRLSAAFAPFGPVASAAAGGIGALVGAISNLAGESVKSAEEAERAARKLRDASAQTAIDDLRADTADKKTEQQRRARQRMSEYEIKVAKRATVSVNEVLDAARWDPGLARRMLDLSRSQNGGATPAELKPLFELYTLPYHRGLDELEEEAAEQERYGMYEWKRQASVFEYLFSEPPTQLIEQLNRIRQLPDEIISAYRSGTGFDPEFESESEELEPVGRVPGGRAGVSAFAASAFPAGTSGVDSLSSAGIGFTGSDPLRREQVELLRSISETLRTIQGRGIPAVAV